MFDNDERIIVLTQNVRRRGETIIMDTPFASNCTIEGKNFDSLLCVLREGHLRTVRAMNNLLRKKHAVSKQDANDLLEGLFDLHLITSNRRMHLTMEEISINPSVIPLAPRTPEDMQMIRAESAYETGVDIPNNATPLMKLIAKRSSVRSFTKRKITNKQAVSLDQAALGGWGIRRSIPSAGGLYPCRVVTLIRNEHNYHTTDHQELSVRRVKNIFVPFAPCIGAPFYIVIIADYERATKKYGARGWRYAILEAGHMAQNVELHAIELGLATCEIGAFKESDCIRILKLSDMDVPLIIIAGGYESKQNKVPRKSLASQLITAYVGSTNIVNSFQVRKRNSAYFPNLYSVRAQTAVSIVHRGKGMDVQIVGAEAATRDLAIAKAIAEGVERFSTGWIPPPEYIGEIGNLEDSHVIHPLELQRYSQNQRVPSRITTFTQRSSASWYKLHQWDNDSEVYVAGDFLFYPYGEDDQQLYSYATSNGVAAHTQKLAALWGATTELLERESLLAWWFSGATPPRLPNTETMHLSHLISAWEAKTIELRFLNITTSIPCVCAVGINHKCRSTFVATACGINLSTAATHACSELLRSITGLEGKTLKRINPNKVRTVEDHLRCFAGGYAFKYVDTWSSGPKIEFDTDCLPSVSNPEIWLHWIIDNIGPLFYYEYALPMGIFHDQPLVVIRSIIPGVVSIKFGYGEQDLGLPRLCKLMKQCRVTGSTTGRLVPKLHPLA
ncbi:YcaO-like family protein [Patescibacteria group bacterium]|nr:YcaO-like family protein [Patescibacteria group bacterium]